MPKALCISGMVISVLLLFFFILDLTPAKFPFGGASAMMDIAFIVCAAALGYLSWTTFREQV